MKSDDWTELLPQLLNCLECLVREISFLRQSISRLNYDFLRLSRQHKWKILETSAAHVSMLIFIFFGLSFFMTFLPSLLALVLRVMLHCGDVSRFVLARDSSVCSASAIWLHQTPASSKGFTSINSSELLSFFLCRNKIIFQFH